MEGEAQAEASSLGAEPSAGPSLVEGSAGTFRIDGLRVPPRLRRCLVTSNTIGSATTGVRLRGGGGTKWRKARTILRCAAAGHLDDEKRFVHMRCVRVSAFHKGRHDI